MKKHIAGGLFIFAALFASYAGDSAVLVDKGFSDNGKYYIFGQYGKTDKSFQAWADIYTVDVAENDYVSGEVYKIKPSSVTFDKTGKEVYDSLADKNYFEISKYNCSAAKPEQVLYIREDDSKSGTDEIVFKDFECSIAKDQAYYHVQLVPDYQGSGIKTKSSFFIMIEKQDENGKVLARQKIGTPSVRRNGVTNYKIERIVSDKTGHNIVCVVEKTTEDKTGLNIRYMVEAAVLNDDFFKYAYESETAVTVSDEDIK